MLLYADEDFSFPVVEELRRFGHDVVTAQEDGHSRIPDQDILARAHLLGRCVLTHNRWEFERLHQQNDPHSGILSATQDHDISALALRIHAAISQLAPGRWCYRINRPSP